MFKLGKRSMGNLIGVNPVLSICVIKGIRRSRYDFGVFEGVRSVSRQKKLVASGRSWTMNSKHLSGNAVDLVPYINGKYVWDGIDASKAFDDIRKVISHEAASIGVTLRYGSDWKTVDRPHIEVTGIDAIGYDYRKYV